MKQFIFASGFLILIFILCLINVKIVNDTMSVIIDLLDKSEYYMDIDDWENAREASLEACYKWEISHRYLTIVISHSSIERISADIASMMEYVYVENAEGFKSQNAIVISMLENIATAERIRIRNIF